MRIRIPFTIALAVTFLCLCPSGFNQSSIAAGEKGGSTATSLSTSTATPTRTATPTPTASSAAAARRAPVPVKLAAIGPLRALEVPQPLQPKSLTQKSVVGYGPVMPAQQPAQQPTQSMNSSGASSGSSSPAGAHPASSGAAMPAPSAPAPSTGAGEPALRGLPEKTPAEFPAKLSPATPVDAGATSGGAAVPPANDRAQVSGTIEYNSKQPVPEGLTLLEALNESLIKGPRAAAIRANLPIAKAGIAQAAMAPNPVFFMDRGFIAEAVERRGVVSTFDPPWKLAFRMMAANRYYHQTKIDLMNTLWQLRADVRRAYTEAVIAQETERTLSQLFDLTNRLLEVSTKRFNAGDVPELDVLRARLASSQAGVDLGVGRQRVVRAKQQLNVILGRVVENSIGIPRLPEFIGEKRVVNPRAIRHGILPDFTRNTPNLQYFIDLSMENRRELKSLHQQLRVNDMNYKNAIANILPNPSVAYGSSSNTNLPSGPKLRAQFMTLNIEMPFSNTNQGEIAKYKAMNRQLRYQVESQRNQIQSQVSSAYNNLLAAREKIHAYQLHVLNDSNEVARLARRSYEVGQSDINSTLLAQQANIQIQMQYLDAVTTYQAAYTDLEQAAGLPLEY